MIEAGADVAGVQPDSYCFTLQVEETDFEHREKNFIAEDEEYSELCNPLLLSLCRNHGAFATNRPRLDLRMELLLLSDVMSAPGVKRLDGL